MSMKVISGKGGILWIINSNQHFFMRYRDLTYFIRGGYPVRKIVIVLNNKNEFEDIWKWYHHNINGTMKPFTRRGYLCHETENHSQYFQKVENGNVMCLFMTGVIVYRGWNSWVGVQLCFQPFTIKSGRFWKGHYRMVMIYFWVSLGYLLRLMRRIGK